LDRAETLFGTRRVAIGGVSSGATLAIATLLRLRDRGLAKPFVGAALQFGSYDLSGQTPAGRLIEDQFFIQAYAGHVADRTNPDISPVYGDLRGLPPALFVVGSLDILLEDNVVMAARLSAAGGEVDVRVYPESPHGFTSLPTAMAGAAVHDIERWLGDRFLDA
jgi:acetyl esterase/lipase